MQLASPYRSGWPAGAADIMESVEGLGESMTNIGYELPSFDEPPSAIVEQPTCGNIAVALDGHIRGWRLLPPFFREEGNAWRIALSMEPQLGRLVRSADTLDEPARSPLRLFEDGYRLDRHIRFIAVFVRPVRGVSSIGRKAMSCCFRALTTVIPTGTAASIVLKGSHPRCPLAVYRAVAGVAEMSRQIMGKSLAETKRAENGLRIGPARITRSGSCTARLLLEMVSSWVIWPFRDDTRQKRALAAGGALHGSGIAAD